MFYIEYKARAFPWKCLLKLEKETVFVANIKFNCGAVIRFEAKMPNVNTAQLEMPFTTLKNANAIHLQTSEWRSNKKALAKHAQRITVI